MISVYINCGLCNQMFQYAAARALSLRLNTELYLELSWYSEKTFERRYELDKYNIVHSEKIPEKSFHLVQENDGKIFEPRVISLPDWSCLFGFWQSEKYFEDYADVIRSELTLKIPLSEKSRNWARKIQNDPVPVSIHIRRGDFISSKLALDIFHQLPLEYYDHAVQILKENFSNLTLYIFSNDMDWCQKVFNYDVPTNFVDCNDELHGYEDLELMKLCKHHIVANSSFSWFGAWLDGRQGSLVFAPDKFYTFEKNIHELERYPDRWIILKS